MQVAQEVGQRRTQRPGRVRGITPLLAPDPKPCQILGLHLLEGFPADLLEISQELIRHTLLGHDGRFCVTPLTARREVLIPDRAETRRAALKGRFVACPTSRTPPANASINKINGRRAS
jgi:hypothetical protein